MSPRDEVGDVTYEELSRDTDAELQISDEYNPVLAIECGNKVGETVAVAQLESTTNSSRQSDGFEVPVSAAIYDMPVTRKYVIKSRTSVRTNSYMVVNIVIQFIWAASEPTQEIAFARVSRLQVLVLV